MPAASYSLSAADHKNRYFNLRRTGPEGRFRLIHVPEGTYMIYVHWRPSDARKPTKWPEDTKFAWHRPLEVRKNMDLDIDVGDGPSP